MTDRRRRLFAFFAFFVAILCSVAAAATREYDAEAAPVAQIDSIDLGGTYAAAESISVTIGNSTLTVTLGSDTTTLSVIATALKNAINAPTIDGSLVGAEKRNAAGQLLPEFTDVEAIIDPADATIVLVRSKVAGVPFGTPAGGNMTVSEASASGTITRASVQAATGPWHWDNATNWSGNTLPVNDDTVVFRDTTKGPKFGLPNGSLEVTVNEYQSFTGPIGLALSNANGYTEYRQAYVRLDDAGTGTNILHRFGLGPGSGSTLINLRHTAVKCTPVVYGTGTPTAPAKALNIVCGESTSTITILKGSVHCGTQDSTNQGWAMINIGSSGTQATDVDAFVGAPGGSGTLYMFGGTVLCHSIANVQQLGGTLRIENTSSGGLAFELFGGKLIWAGSGTITSLEIDGGDFDNGQNAQASTVTSTTTRRGALRDPFRKLTFTNNVQHFGKLSEFTFDFGTNFEFKPSPL